MWICVSMIWSFDQTTCTNYFAIKYCFKSFFSDKNDISACFFMQQWGISARFFMQQWKFLFPRKEMIDWGAKPEVIISFRGNRNFHSCTLFRSYFLLGYKNDISTRFFSCNNEISIPSERNDEFGLRTSLIHYFPWE